MTTPSRRQFLQLLGAAATGVTGAFGQAPAIVRAQSSMPVVDYGVASGDVGIDRALVWAHADRPSRMVVEYSTTESFRRVQRVRGSMATPDTGLTARAALRGLPPGQQVFYRVSFEDASNSRVVSQPVGGFFRTASATPANVKLAWSADTVGQGWGIDEARGGMRLFETMRQANPDVFINVGDTIYADQPLQESVTLDDGTIWKNLVTPAKSKVAETLDEYRGAHLYNRLDAHYKRFAAEVPQVTLWDDHEVRDNWFPQQTLRDQRYGEKSVRVLADRARRAFLEHYPIPLEADGTGRVYRTIAYGPLVEIFALDMRQYRGPNSDNLQATLDAESAFMGAEQVRWLQQRLAASRATWKVIAADMPLSVVVAHAPHEHEAVANDDPGAPLGRELEIGGLLRFIKEQRIRNVVWITADVHYCAAHHFHPDRAAFKDFDPFWEFVAGPAHAGTFAPGPLDRTFGPELKFSGVPQDLKPNRPPTDGLQFFGTLNVDARTRVLTVQLHNLSGAAIYTNELSPA
ncbi:MAG: alkaline phosphatase D family protein [Vicinamibacterales bacterium]